VSGPRAEPGRVTTVAAIERRLTDLRHEAAGEHPGSRTNVVALVVWCGTRELADEAAEAISNLSHNRPSRAIVLEPDPAAADVRSDEAVFCALPPDRARNVLVCSEVVRLRGPGRAGALAAMTRSLLLPDLPLVVLWLDEPDWEHEDARGLLASATRLVVDSQRDPRALDALPRLVGAETPYICDLAWTKITGWREVVAQLFDPPSHLALLPRLERIVVRYAEGSPSQARLMAGWLHSRGARSARLELDPVTRDDMRGGSLVGVELAVDDFVLSVERPEEGVAVTHSPGLRDQRLSLRVPPFAALLGDELEFLPRDRVFEAALASCTAAS
jgi:glucose-6-phosphate dehydrogenase assembly protein OpcA